VLVALEAHHEQTMVQMAEILYFHLSQQQVVVGEHIVKALEVLDRMVVQVVVQENPVLVLPELE
jgi:hypothetical protein